MDEVKREILLAFWKVRILHRASEGPVHGHLMLRELRDSGHDISPGTLYPVFRRMEQRGWLRSEADPARGPRGRRDFHLTDAGRRVLDMVRQQVAELHREVNGP